MDFKGIGEGLINYANEVELIIALDQHTILGNRIAFKCSCSGRFRSICPSDWRSTDGSEIKRIIDCFADRPHIFNLGHGVVPQLQACSRPCRFH